MKLRLKLKEPITFHSAPDSGALTREKKKEVEGNFRTYSQALVDDLKVHGDSFSVAAGDATKQKVAIDLVANEVGRLGTYRFIPGVERAVLKYRELSAENRSEAKAKLLEDIVENFTNESSTCFG